MSIKIKFFIVIALCALNTFANKVHVFIISQPEDAEVFINGQFVGHTPIKNKIEILENQTRTWDVVIKKKSFENYQISFPEDNFFRSIKWDVTLKKLHFSANQEMKEKLYFEKTIADIKENEIVGTFNGLKYKWGANSNDFATTDFNGIATTELETSKFNIYKPNKLFNDNILEAPVRFILGATLKVVNLSNCIKLPSRTNACINIEVEWSLFDRKSNKTILTTRNKGYGSGVNIEESFKNSFQDCLRAMLFDSSLYNTILKYSEPTEEKQNDTSGFSMTLDLVKLPELKSTSEIAAYATPAVVTIISEYGHGSGFFVSPTGFILTNQHVINEAKSIKVVLSSGVTLDARIEYEDAKFDLAILKVNGSGFKPLAIGSQDLIKPGAEVIAIGAPYSTELSHSVTRGIVSGIRLIEGQRLIQTDVTLNQGNSGGPIIDSNGKVIGIAVSGLKKEGLQGLNFAIPIDVIINRLNITIK